MDTCSLQVGLHMIKKDEMNITEDLKESDSPNENVFTEKNSSMLIDDSSKNTTILSNLQQQIQRLEEENNSLKEEKKSLEIDNICLEQHNFELKTRIDDFAIQYPSASILLGRKPVEQKKNKRLTLKWKKRK